MSRIPQPSKRCKHCRARLRRRPGEWPSWFKRRNFCNADCQRLYRKPRGDYSPRTRYRKILANGKPRQEHRVVMEQVLERPLRRDEYVHHLNGDGFDNRPDNLVVVSAHDHAQWHQNKHPRHKQCIICGRPFTPNPTKRGRQRACGWQCGKQLRGLVLSGQLPALGKDVTVSHVHHLAYQGVTLTIREWSNRLGIKYATIFYRLKHGWSIDRVLQQND